MVRVPDLVLMHPQNVFITDILSAFLSYQPAARKIFINISMRHGLTQFQHVTDPRNESVIDR